MRRWRSSRREDGSAAVLDPERVNHANLLRFLALRHRARSYLEIGAADGYTMFRVPVRRKVGVEPFDRVSRRDRARYARASLRNLTFRVHRETSDEYFAHAGAERFDLVFVDGKHTREQVLRDVRSALAVLSPRGLVVVHDTNPGDAAEAWPAESLAAAAADEPPGWRGRWCGDVWKAIVELRQESPELGVVTLAADYGMTVISPRIRSEHPLEALVDVGSLSFADFDRQRAAWLALREPAELERWLAQDPGLAPAAAPTRAGRGERARRRTAVVAVAVAAGFVLFGAVPELLGDRPYNPFGKDSRVAHHHRGAEPA